jgi:predicted nucleic acid-binding protein
MPVRVVDASALGALVFGEPRADEMAKALSGGSLVAPALVWFELASICLRKIMVYPGQTDEILKAFMLARHLSVETVEVDHSAVIKLATEVTLTTYDASYLWLTIHLSGELVTLDRKLKKAAESLMKKASLKFLNTDH